MPMPKTSAKATAKGRSKRAAAAKDNWFHRDDKPSGKPAAKPAQPKAKPRPSVSPEGYDLLLARGTTWNAGGGKANRMMPNTTGQRAVRSFNSPRGNRMKLGQ